MTRPRPTSNLGGGTRKERDANLTEQQKLDLEHAEQALASLGPELEGTKTRVEWIDKNGIIKWNATFVRRKHAHEYANEGIEKGYEVRFVRVQPQQER